MPIIIRIILQGIIAGMLAVMTFLGLSPGATIPTTEQVEIRTHEQRKLVDDVLRIRSSTTSSENIISAIDDVINFIDQKRKEIENLPSQENLIISPAPQQSLPTIISVPSLAQKPEDETRGLDDGDKIEENVQTIEVVKSQIREIQDVAQPEGQMEVLADVVVNIICTQQKGGMTTASTGSGVLISPKGVILTNAHVAQFFILENAGFDIKCAIYRESIPTFGYKADILYISPDWISKNFTTISDLNPRGTGEKDFALLLITKNTNPVLSIPSQFSYAKLNLDQNIYVKNQPIRVAGFPGTPLNIFDLAKAGSLKVDNNQIQDIFTFRNRNSIDILSTYNTPVAAKGASGGGVFYKNDLIGITVTISPEGNGTKINAITTTYINEVLEEESGKNLINFLSENLEEKRKSFETKYLYDMATLLNSQL